MPRLNVCSPSLLDPADVPAPYSYDPSLGKSPSDVALSEDATKKSEIIASVKRGRGVVRGRLQPVRKVKGRVVGPRLTRKQQAAEAERLRRERVWDASHARVEPNEARYIGARRYFDGAPKGEARRPMPFHPDYPAAAPGPEGDTQGGPGLAHSPSRPSVGHEGFAAGAGERKTKRAGRNPRHARMRDRQKAQPSAADPLLLQREAMWESRHHRSYNNKGKPLRMREYFDSPRTIDSTTTPRTVPPSLKLHPDDRIDRPVDENGFYVSPIHNLHKAVRSSRAQLPPAGPPPDGSQSARTLRDLGPAGEAAARKAEAVNGVPLSARTYDASEDADKLRLRIKTRKSPRARRREAQWDSRHALARSALATAKKKRRRGHGDRAKTASPGPAELALERVDSFLERGEFSAVPTIDPATIKGGEPLVMTESFDEPLEMRPPTSLPSVGEVSDEGEPFEPSSLKAAPKPVQPRAVRRSFAGDVGQPPSLSPSLTPRTKPKPRRSKASRKSNASTAASLASSGTPVATTPSARAAPAPAAKPDASVGASVAEDSYEDSFEAADDEPAAPVAKATAVRPTSSQEAEVAAMAEIAAREVQNAGPTADEEAEVAAMTDLAADELISVSDAGSPAHAGHAPPEVKSGASAASNGDVDATHGGDAAPVESEDNDGYSEDDFEASGGAA